MHKVFYCFKMADISRDKLVPLPNGKSTVWAYYGFPVNSFGKIIDKKKVYCKLCEPPFPISYSTNTSNLTYHLKRLHPEQHKELSGTQQSREVSDGFRQTPVFTPSVKPYSRTSKRAKQLVHATGKFIALSLQPMNIVDEPSFRILLSVADPRFNLLHRTRFASKVMPQMYVIE